MHLNMHILAQDLADLDLHGKIHRQVYEYPLRLATILDDVAPIKTDRLYIATSADLDSRGHGIPRDATVLCIGKPDALPNEIADQITLLWTQRDISPLGLLERVNELFARYDDWIEATDDSFAHGRPLRCVAEQSEEIFDNPLWMWDSQNQTVFHVLTEGRYVLPPRYQMHVDQTPWPINELNAINDDFRRAMKNRDPYTLPPHFGYVSLCYNFFEGDEYVATLAVDGINGRGFTNRDRALLKVLGDRMSPGLIYEAHFGKHTTYLANEVLEQLLSGISVPYSRISSAFGSMGWSPDDSFYCILAHQPPATRYPAAFLIPIAQQICDKVPGIVFSISDDSIVFIANHTLANIHPDDACDEISKILDSHDIVMQLGVSTPFRNLSDVRFFRSQAHEAIHVGEGVDPHNKVFMFHDYVLKAIINRCLGGTIPQTLYPPSISRLLAYDKAHDGDLVYTLRAYLENDSSTKRTAEKLFMHRNTLLSRLNKIESVGKVDLKDYKTRLVLSFVLAVMDETS